MHICKPFSFGRTIWNGEILGTLSPKPEMCYSKDDEGNQFNDVIFEPTVGFKDKYDFTAETEPSFEGSVNCVCIN